MQKHKGFTLIELLVVIAIIGLLSTLAVVSLNSARQKSRDAKRVADVKQIQTALELFFQDQNGYPGETAASVLGGTNYACLDATSFTATGCSSPYMGLVPSAPTPPSGNTYTYSAWTDSAKGTACTTGVACGYYEVGFTLEGATGGLALGAHTASPSGIQ